MPRLLKRIVETVQNEAGPDRFFPLANKIRRPKSLFEPDACYLKPPPSLNPARYTRSILLDDPATNIITRSKLYLPHKRLPPRVALPVNPQVRKGETDAPHEMTEHEKRWWANPYLRIISSPTRMCLETDQYLPTDLLIRLSFLQVPASNGGKPALAMVPDGIQHTKFTARRGGKAIYVLCLREVLQQTMSSGKYKRILRNSNEVIINSQLPEHILHLLRLRVLQELDLVGNRLKSTKKSSIDPNTSRLIRQLTREELASIKSKGIIPFENALAVLDFPLEEENSINNGEEDSLGMSPLPPPLGERTPSDKSSPPLSTLMPGSTQPYTSSGKPPVSSQLLSASCVPFYNGLTAFPYQSQRTALRGLLTRLITLEESRRVDGQATPTGTSDPKSYSDAYLLSADSQNVKFGDMAAVAVALWRLRMFESGGWLNTQSRWSLGTNHDVRSLL